MSLRIRQWIFPFLAFFVSVFIVFLLFATKKAPEKKALSKPLPIVRTEMVRLTDTQLNAHSQGTLEPKYETRLISQVDGEVIKLSEKFVVGGRVKKGELLLQLNPFDYEVKLQQAVADLARSRAAYIHEQAQGQVASNQWQQIPEAEPTVLGLRKPQLATALADVEAAEASYKQAKKNLERTSLHAPYDALIKSRTVSVGSYLSSGTSLAEILDMSVGEIRLPITQSEMRYLVDGGLGAKVILDGEALGEKFQWDATIVREEGIIDSSSRMRHLVAEVTRPYDSNLAFGTYLTAEILGRTLHDSVKIPREVIRDNKVPILVNGQLSYKAISIARHLNDETIVDRGLNEGDAIIVSPLAYPIEGMSVKPLDLPPETLLSHEKIGQQP